jgi:hypothetical protein
MIVNQFAAALNHGMELAKAIEEGEPVYHFIPGTGWIPTVGPVELQVKESEVQAGDVILQWKWPSGEVSDRWAGGWRVLKVANNVISTEGNSRFHTVNGSVEWFLVRRA